ncbi:MAG TPA: hypothetical protein VN873_12725 [Candidatus Angelobacter sp.]|nr:hypothetical protein [Candidatus Angelobacter sp.]
MSTTEAIMEKVSALPPEKREEVLRYIESISEAADKSGDPYEWMKIAASMKLEGPPDLSEHLDDYLYGDKKDAW